MLKRVIFIVLGSILVIFSLAYIYQRKVEMKSIVPLGTRIFPKGEPEWNDKGFTEAFKKAREGGMSIAIWGVQWGRVEPFIGKYDWSFINYRILKTKQQKFKCALIIEIIRTNKLGLFPQDLDFKGFNDSSFLHTFKLFIRELLKQYPKQIQYLFIGNEVNCYLHIHPEQAESFRNFCREIFSEIKSIDSEIKVGVVGAYHIARNYNEIGLLKNIVGIGDIAVLTIYIEGDHANLNVEDTEKYFNEMFKLFPDKRIAITETGWSSNGPKGSEDKQVEYIKRLSDVARKNGDRIEFISWVLLYDISEKLNKQIAESFNINIETVDGENFLKWQGSLGLLKNNGDEKPAWNAWKKYMLKS